jgi:hypothetical protein
MGDVKTIGASGQISLGKQYAGRTVTIDQPEEGVWVIKTAQVIPDNELWLHTPEVKAQLDRAWEWALTHKPVETDLDEMERMLKAHHAKKTKRRAS